MPQVNGIEQGIRQAMQRSLCLLAQTRSLYITPALSRPVTHCIHTFRPTQTRQYAYRPRPHDLKGPKPLLYTVPSDPAPVQRYLQDLVGGYITTPIGHLHSSASVRVLPETSDGSASTTPGAVFDDELVLQIFTHKSFNHGRSPYNDKLAFIGRKVVELAVAERLMFGEVGRPAVAPDVFREGRDVGGSTGEAYEASESAELWQEALTPDTGDESTNTAAAAIDADSTLTVDRLHHFTSASRIGNVVTDHYPDMASYLRWKPKDTANDRRSGVRKVAADALMALVGALDLRYGNDVSRRFVDDKVVPLLNVTSADVDTSVNERQYGAGRQRQS